MWNGSIFCPLECSTGHFTSAEKNVDEALIKLALEGKVEPILETDAKNI